MCDSTSPGFVGGATDGVVVGVEKPYAGHFGLGEQRLDWREIEQDLLGGRIPSRTLIQPST